MPALSALLACTVIGLADGDTLSARCDIPEGKVHLTIRLADIDAPEKAQAWGQRSRQHLASLCFGKSALVQVRTTDRYGRTVARVECDGTDASAEQVRAGMAMVFDRYVRDMTLYGVQNEARAAQRGLWSDPAPMPPWKFRHSKEIERDDH